jgi:uncharacterized protein (DUF1501 family)
MCDTLHKGASLDHGQAHADDHAKWTRRDFLTAGLAAGFGFLIGNTPVKAFASHPMLSMLGSLETDRVLVLIQLNGGNDGLNTVIPIQNDIYYQKRPGIGIRANDAYVLNPEVALHPGLRGFEPMWEEGKLGIVRNVGYTSPNLSHFRATDIMVTGSDSDVLTQTGWMGRFLNGEYPEYQATDFPHPLAVQIGTNQSLLFQGPESGMSMNISSIGLFERLANDGKAYDAEAVPNTLYGQELAYLRSLTNQSYTFAGVVHEASGRATNEVAYPAGNALAANLAIVAKLIKGNLGAKVYMVALNGFDTHANQLASHDNLMRNLTGAVTSFYADLAKKEMDGKVTAMTFSEFGRRVNQNGSSGTDHGSSAPMLVFGGGVKGGLIGSEPSLSSLDANGNLLYETDYRQVYATMINDWFGVPAAVTADVFGRSFTKLDLIKEPATTGLRTDEARPNQIALEQNVPNPFNPRTLIRYRVGAHGDAPLRLSVYDMMGREIQVLVDGWMPAGEHRVDFDGSGLASGVYIARLVTGGQVMSIKMSLVK